MNNLWPSQAQKRTHITYNNYIYIPDLIFNHHADSFYKSFAINIFVL